MSKENSTVSKMETPTLTEQWRNGTLEEGLYYIEGKGNYDIDELKDRHYYLVKFILYLIRWQLSTPILALAMVAFSDFGTWWATIIANLIGGCIFFFVDKLIFERGFETRTSSSVKNSSFNKNLYVDKHQKKQ